jgi:hypothetical protein
LDSGSEDEVEDDDDEYRGSSKRTPLRQKTNQPKFPPASYGNIRPIAAINQDDYPEDSENERLRAHRGTCEKCHLAPANKLLQVTKKGKSKGKKRKRGSEDEFDYSDDEDRYRELGGWVRWYVLLTWNILGIVMLTVPSLKCPVSSHWSCLAGTQRDEILKAMRAKLKRDWKSEGKDLDNMPRRKFLEVDEMTEFNCGEITYFSDCTVTQTAYSELHEGWCMHGLHGRHPPCGGYPTGRHQWRY